MCKIPCPPPVVKKIISDISCLTDYKAIKQGGESKKETMHLDNDILKSYPSQKAAKFP